MMDVETHVLPVGIVSHQAFLAGVGIPGENPPLEENPYLVVVHVDGLVRALEGRRPTLGYHLVDEAGQLPILLALSRLAGEVPVPPTTIGAGD